MSRTACEDSPPGSALPMEAYLDDARSLDPEAFAARHGAAFLLLTATGLSQPADTSSTRLQLLEDEDGASAHTADLAILVYPVRSAVHIATLGRSPTNDVVIPDPSISRLHAFVKRTETGGFLVLDAGSTNGTMVNGASVLARGHGPATPLKAGDSVRLGQVQFTFVDARGLREFVLQSAG